MEGFTGSGSLDHVRTNAFGSPGSAGLQDIAWVIFG